MNKYGEAFAPPPGSVDTAAPHSRAADRMQTLEGGKKRDQAIKNIRDARRAIDSALPVYQKQLLDRATALDEKAKTAPESERAGLQASAARFRQASQDLGRVTMGTLGVESNFGTGPLNTRADGPAQATAEAQRDLAKKFGKMDPELGSLDRKTMAGAARVALAHHTMRTLEFDGSLQRAVSQFNGGNRDGMAYTRLSQQNGYVAAVYSLGRQTENVGR